MKPLTLISRLAVIELSLAGCMLSDETLRKMYGTYATCEEAKKKLGVGQEKISFMPRGYKTLLELEPEILNLASLIQGKAELEKTEKNGEYVIYNNYYVSLVSEEVLYILDNSDISTNPPDKIITREEFDVFKKKIYEKYLGTKFKKTKIKLTKK